MFANKFLTVFRDSEGNICKKVYDNDYFEDKYDCYLMADKWFDFIVKFKSFRAISITFYNNNKRVLCLKARFDYLCSGENFYE